jgi:hypothetical protein
MCICAAGIAFPRSFAARHGILLQVQHAVAVELA